MTRTTRTTQGETDFLDREEGKIVDDAWAIAYFSGDFHDHLITLKKKVDRVRGEKRLPRLSPGEIQAFWQLFNNFGKETARELGLTTALASRYGVEEEKAQVILSDIWSSMGPSFASADEIAV